MFARCLSEKPTCDEIGHCFSKHLVFHLLFNILTILGPKNEKPGLGSASSFWCVLAALDAEQPAPETAGSAQTRFLISLA